MPLSDDIDRKSLSAKTYEYCESRGFDVDADSYGATVFFEDEEGNRVALDIDFDEDTVIVEWGEPEQDREEWSRKEFSGENGDTLDKVKRYVL